MIIEDLIDDYDKRHCGDVTTINNLASGFHDCRKNKGDVNNGVIW